MAPTRTEDARERLLAAAGELFYAEGVHTVGIDRVIEHAGVAKATLYNAFGSKDELIRAYLTRRYELWQELLAERLARYDTPRDRLVGVFDWLAAFLADPEFNGCAFMNASAEEPRGGPAEEPSRVYRDAVRSLFTGLAQEAGAVEPEQLGRQLALLYDGATIGARMDRTSTAGTTARTIAVALIDAATGPTKRRAKRRSKSEGGAS
jgi:AcrR family transcriptional regulator